MNNKIKAGPDPYHEHEGDIHSSFIDAASSLAVPGAYSMTIDKDETHRKQGPEMADRGGEEE